jgi:acyl-coenzyme A synthetase/AMP-(fatty) acid ligase
MSFPFERYGLTIDNAARRAAHESPAQVICRKGTTSLTLGQLNDQASRLANTLIANGFQQGDRVALLMPMCMESLTACVAVARAGGVSEFLLPNYGAELVPMLRPAPPRWLFYSTMHQNEAAPIAAEYGTQAAVLEDSAPAQWHWSEMIEAGSGDAPPAIITPDDDAMIVFTSGTTGTPKAVRRSQDSVMTLGMLYKQYLEFDHSSVIGSMMITNEVIAELLADSGCLVLGDMLQPREWLATMERERITHTGGVTSLLQLWLSYPDWAQFDLSALKSITVGAMTTPPELHAELYRRAGVRLIQVYGSNEAGMLTINTNTSGPKLASLGLPVEGKAVRVIDENGEDAPVGDVGELIARPTGEHELGFMRGYCDDTPTLWKDGWLHTGDLVYQDSDDYIYLLGRTFDTINVAGHKIYSPEVERVLASHPAVAEVAVVGQPDEMRGEIVVAYLVPKPGNAVTISEIREFCGKHLASHKIPRRVLVQDSLPRTATGKVNKQALKELLID